MFFTDMNGGFHNMGEQNGFDALARKRQEDACGQRQRKD